MDALSTRRAPGPPTAVYFSSARRRAVIGCAAAMVLAALAASPVRAEGPAAPPAQGTGDAAAVDPAVPAPAAHAPAERDAIEKELIRVPGRKRTSAGLGGDGSDPRPTGRTGGMLWRSLSGLAIVVGLMVLGTVILKRAVPGMKRGGTEAVTVLGRAYVSPKHALHLVKVGRRILVVGQTPSGISSVAEIDDPDEVEQVTATCQQSRPSSITSTFRQLLRREDAAYDEMQPDAAVPETAEDLDPYETAPHDEVGVVRRELDAILDRVRTWRQGGTQSGDDPGSPSA